MDNFLKTTDGFETTLKLIETINRSTDDYLFIWDFVEDKRWFFGDIDRNYDIRKTGDHINSTPDMMRIIHPADQKAVQESLSEILQGKKDTHNMDYRWINRRGEKVWINCHGTVVAGKDGERRLMIGRVSEEHLRHLFNPLTSLWNKTKLRQDIKLYLVNSAGYLMFLDIDGLAAINLSHSREYGDRLLKDVAEFCENMEGVETAYHIDHNYFALVMNTKSEEDVSEVYKNIKNAFKEKCTFTAAAVPIERSLFLDETQLLDSINLTLKKAKGISNNRLEFFSREDLSEKITSLALLEELKGSVENDFEGFELYYQPQVKAGSYDIYGVEALLRYNSKKRGKVFPDEFIPVLEGSRLIKKVGLWVLQSALEQCKKWREVLPNLHISVNFSTVQFKDIALAEKVMRIIQEAGIPSSALTIEITESAELHQSSLLANTLSHLKEFGVHLAIDDFGTGYSNLSYLKQLNIDEIKIDRVFISGIEKDTYNHKLISNVIEFAKTNAIRTCCEGVENTRELVTLELLLPDIIQGYLFDKPTTADMIEKTYIDSSAPEFKQRMDFVHKIYNLKENMGILHFNPKDILRENGVGLWKMRFHPEKNLFEFHIDETSERVFAVDMKYTPKECYEFFLSNVAENYKEYVTSTIESLMHSDKAVQIEFPWKHANFGNVTVRFSGKRVNNSDGMIVMEGYHRIITDISIIEKEENK
ncbi:MAG: EAL domain-containing protein [Clostridia bacterium]|nr:EAL domain-containing protein [Clostridia bacterium]